MTGRLLVAECIGKAYGNRSVLRSAYVHVMRGCISVLVGRNGSGKSTLLNIVSGLLRPDRGTVRYEEIQYARPYLHQLAAKGLFVIPATRSFLSPSRTVEDHLEAVARHCQSGWRDTAEELGVTSILDQPTRELSSGERRCVELAVAIIRSPRCLVADEPLRDLSPLATEMVSACLTRLAQQGCGIIISGHELAFLLPLAHEVFWLVNGTTRHVGAPETTLTNWSFRREFLDR